MGWNLAHQIVAQAVSAAVFFFLARHLPPAAFGVVALAAIVVDAFASEAKAAAVDLLLIRRDFSGRQLATVFWAGCGLAAAAWLAAVGAAGLYARQTGMTELPAVVTALGLSAALAPLTAVYEALALKDLGFRALGVRGIVATLVSAAAALAAVLLGAGVWALVVQRVAASAAGVLFLGLHIRWAPAAAFDGGLARSLGPDFLKLWSSQLLTFGLGRVLDLVIGLRLGVGALGLYRVGNRFIELVQAGVTAPLTSVFIPLLTRFDSPALQARHYRELCALAALLTAPCFVGLALVADDLVRLLFGPDYAPVSLALALLAAAGLVAPFAYFRGVALTAARRPGLAAALNVADLGATAVAVWAGATWGLPGVLVASLGVSAAAALVTVATVGRVLGVRPWPLVGVCLPPYGAAAVMAAVVAAAGRVLATASGEIRLAALVLAGCVTYAAYLAAFHRKWLMGRLDYLGSRRANLPEPTGGDGGSGLRQA